MTQVKLLLGASLLGLGVSLSACQSPNATAEDAQQGIYASASEANTSNRQNISKDWQYLENAATRPQMALSQSAWEAVDLPHTWNAFDTTDVITGYRRDGSWYRKTLDMAPKEDKRYFLHFEAAQMKADVYVNGEKAGDHTGGYVSFDIEITDHIKSGQNEILVRVDNSVDKNLVPSQKADFFQYGGLTRDVWVETRPESFLEQVRVQTPDVSQTSATVKLSMFTNAKTEFSPSGFYTEIKAPDGTQIASGDSTEFTIKDPALWSPDEPNLYSFRTDMIGADGAVIDSYEDRFGLRFFEFEPHSYFKLNGDRLLLRGTHLHEEHAGYGAAMTDEQRMEDMRMIKEMGANFVRLGHYPQDPVVYDMADELGLIVWDEVPWNRGGVGGEEWRANTQHLTRRMIEQNYNRPSIFFWSLGNEMYWLPDFDGGGDKEKVKSELQALEDIAKEMDPGRLTSIRKFPEGSEVIDVYSPSIWAGWYGGGYNQYADAVKKYRQENEAFLHMEYGGSSHVGRHLEDPFSGYGTSDPGRQGSVEEAVNQTGVTSVAKSKVWDETYMVDLFDWHLRVSETDPDFAGNAQWAFKDFGTPIRPENPLPFVNQKGLVTRKGDKKDVYHVFASYWAKDPTCWIESPSWTYRVGEKGEAKTISVFCNTDSAELSLNGQPLGSKLRDINKFPASGLTWDVQFKEGQNRLSVEGFNADGDLVAEHGYSLIYKTQPAGKMTDIVLTTSDNADGTMTIFAEAQDKDGNRCLSCNERIYFTQDGGGSLVENMGTPTGSRTRELASGTASILFIPGETEARIGIQSQDYRGYYITIPPK